MSSATVAVDKATSDLLLGPDWTTNMEICDSVNSLHWDGKDVVKAVKKRLQHKSANVQQLTLTLLETLVKNCGNYLHHQVAERNVLGEMVRIVRKRGDMQARDKVLVLLDSWQQAFGGPEGKYPQYYWAYDELRRSGVEFPRRSPGASPPIITPPVSQPPVRELQGGYGYGNGIPQLGYGVPNGTSRRLDEALANDVDGLSLSSLESMRDVLDLLGDMLQAVEPSNREAVKDEVIVELVERCRSNQKKLMQTLNSTEDDELLSRGLDLNDSLQTLLARHDAIASGSPLPVQTWKPAESSPRDSSSVASSSSPILAVVPTGKSLIDEEEEDEFAQLARRHTKPVTTDPTTSSDSLALTLTDQPPPPVKTSQEQDLIDLLSITLSTPFTPTPESSQPLPSVSDQNSNMYYPQAPPQQFNTYVAPWAQQSQQQPQTQTQQGYSQPQQYPQTQQPYSQPQQQQYQTQQGYSQPQPQAQFQMQQESRPRNPYEYPPPPWASASANAYYTPRANATATASPYTDGRSLQQSNSFPARAADPPQVTSTASNPSGQKPFVPSYRLFDDLNVFGTADGNHNKSTNNINGSQRKMI